MRKPVPVWLGLAITTILVSSVTQARPSQQTAPDENKTYHDGDIGKRIVAYLERAEAVGFSGVVLAARDGKVVAAVGAGCADIEGTMPNTPATLFEIASVTKPFTAAAVVRLAQEGKLRLDDSIALHLPGVPEDCKGITVRHLLQHTSGIPRTNAQAGGDDLGKVLPVFLRGGPKHPPGTHWEYWNQGYGLLSEIIARTSGKSYTAYCKEALFTPAGMHLTRFTGDAAPEGARVAEGYSARGPARSALDHPYGTYGFQYRGMGGLVTSAWDLWRWDRALHGDSLLTTASKAEYFKPGVGDYALGWFVRRNAKGKLVQSHSGGVRGFISEVRRYPEENGCLFVLCNRDDGPLMQVARAVEEHLFGDPAKVIAPPLPLDAATVKGLAGRYKDAQGAILTVEEDGKITRARIAWHARSPAASAVLGRNAEGDVLFFDWNARMKLTLDRDAAGTVKQLSIPGRAFARVAEDK